MTSNTACAAPPAPSGCLSLPILDDAVPARLGQERLRQRTLARFAIAAARSGVQLPAGGFHAIEQVLVAQWNGFLARRDPTGSADVLAGTPVLEIDDDALRVVIHAQSRLNAYRLRPVIEQLEAQATGLGWFVEGVLTQASAHGLQIYDMRMASTLLDVFHGELEEFSDPGYARAILQAHGDAAGDAAAPIPQDTLDALRSDYGFWPSDLLADVGGHGHLLAPWYSRQGARPQTMGARCATRWLRRHRGHAGAVVVNAALRLQRALARDRERAFVWTGDDDTEPLGALCFLAWDAPELLLEAVQHFEENQYSGGLAVEAFARCVLPLSQASDAQLRQLARRTAAYLHRWTLLAQLLAHFPLWEDGDAA